MKLKTLLFSIILLTTLYACKQKKNQIHTETKLTTINQQNKEIVSSSIKTSTTNKRNVAVESIDVNEYKSAIWGYNYSKGELTIRNSKKTINKSFHAFKSMANTSPNNKIISISTFDKSNSKFDIELIRSDGDLIASEKISGLLKHYHDEGMDEIIPFDNGSGFCQIANSMGGDLHFAIYKERAGRFKKVMEVDSSRTTTGLPTRYCNGIISNEEGDAFIVNSFRNLSNSKTESIIAKYSITGEIVWKKIIDSKVEIHDQFNRVIGFGDKIPILKNDVNSTLLLLDSKNGKTIKEYIVSDCCIEFLYEQDNLFATGERNLHLLSHNKTISIKKLLDLDDEMQVRVQDLVVFKNTLYTTYSTNYKYPDKRYNKTIEQGILIIPPDLIPHVLTFEAMGNIEIQKIDTAYITIKALDDKNEPNYHRIKNYNMLKINNLKTISTF